MRRIYMHIPDYIWERYQEIEETIPANTMTGKILILMEKGINFYGKAKKKTAGNTKPAAVTHETALDQSASQEDYSESIEKTLEIAKVRWVD